MDMTVGDALSALLQTEELKDLLDTEVDASASLGEIIDFLAADESVQGLRNEGIDIHMTVGDAIDMAGREEIMARVEETASEAMYDPDYSYTAGNILHNWIHILIFILVFALLSVVTLEFIDKDKR
jgi:hypothetical protein